MSGIAERRILLAKMVACNYFTEIAAWNCNARQQAARGTFDPAYLNYTLGKLMIIKLCDDWTKTRGGRKAWKQFHDEFLSRGGPPIPLIRAAMLGPRDKGPLLAEP